jgi:hypothetical protein
MDVLVLVLVLVLVHVAPRKRASGHVHVAGYRPVAALCRFFAARASPSVWE